jgi:hypothetical protein
MTKGYVVHRYKQQDVGIYGTGESARFFIESCSQPEYYSISERNWYDDHGIKHPVSHLSRLTREALQRRSGDTQDSTQTATRKGNLIR